MSMRTPIQFPNNMLPRRQSGAALIVGLLLLLVMTILAVAGMGTASLELQMAGNEQASMNSFQAAETGIESVISKGTFDTGNLPSVPATSINSGPAAASYSATTTFDPATGITDIPAKPGSGSSGGVGGKGFKAYHFDVTGVGTSSRQSRAEHTQSFYVEGPG